jgi:phosphoglycolate phosphatase-like HAD superfamily hydrolase
MVNFQSERDPDSRPGQEGCGVAASLGAPEGGALPGPSLQKLLETVLAACPCEGVFLSPSLLPHWGHRIEDRGGRALPLADRAPHGRESLRAVLAAATAGDQVWLDLGDPAGGADEGELEAFLEAAGAGPGFLVVLLRDDHPARARSQRLAVDRPGQVLLLRETAGAPGYALGRPELVRRLAASATWALDGRPLVPLAGAGGRLLVLDVDGVLIDPGRAFMEAVAGALGQLAPDLAWHDEDYLSLKRAGGFNNDFRLAAGALALAERGELPYRAESGGLDRLDARIREWEPRCRTAVREHYTRTRRLERPMVTREQLAAVPGHVAIFTGRPPQELGFAFELLGFALPAVGDSAPHLRKPRPEGLIQLADAFRADRVTFVGDSRDDAAALRGAAALRPELGWRFAAVGADRCRFAADGDLQADGLMDLIESGDLP